jgi:hypothetical protein
MTAIGPEAWRIMYLTLEITEQLSLRANGRFSVYFELIYKSLYATRMPPTQNILAVHLRSDSLSGDALL